MAYQSEQDNISTIIPFGMSHIILGLQIFSDEYDCIESRRHFNAGLELLNSANEIILEHTESCASLQEDVHTQEAGGINSPQVPEEISPIIVNRRRGCGCSAASLGNGAGNGLLSFLGSFLFR